jgi:hypothetical protein
MVVKDISVLILMILKLLCCTLISLPFGIDLFVLVAKHRDLVLCTTTSYSEGPGLDSQVYLVLFSPSMQMLG